MNAIEARYLQEIEEEYDFINKVQLLTPIQLERGESEIIQQQYEAAMTRRRSYVCDLEAHIYSGYDVYIHKYKKSYLVGYKVGEVFIISHFAPFSLREGAEMIRRLGMAVAAVTEDLSPMLEKCGWSFCGQIPQQFDGDICIKDVWTSKLQNRHIHYLLSIFGFN